MKHRIGAKTGNLARVLAVVAIVMVSVMTTLSLGAVALADSPVYAPSQSTFIYGGNEYSPLFYRADTGYYYHTGQNGWDMSGENDIDCGLYSVGDGNASILYEHGQKAVIDGRFGSPIDYSESLFVPNDGYHCHTVPHGIYYRAVVCHRQERGHVNGNQNRGYNHDCGYGGGRGHNHRISGSGIQIGAFNN